MTHTPPVMPAQNSTAALPTPKRIWIDLLVLAALLGLNVAVLLLKGTERFEFFDMSGFMDGGYRIWIGQEPYVDFYYITGPVHLYMHALSFALFGFTKTAVLMHLAIVWLAATAIVYVIARQHLRRIPSTLLALLALYSFYGPVSHPWYDQNATIWILIGILLWEVLWTRAALFVTISCGILAAISFMTKGNVGLAGGVVFLSLIATQPRWLKHVSIYVVTGLLTLGVFALVLQRPGNFISQAFFAYRPGARLLNMTTLLNVFWNSFNLLIAGLGLALMLLGGRAWVRANGTRLALLASMVFAGIFTGWTSSMSIHGNLVWLSLQFTYVFILASSLDLSRFGTRERALKMATGFVPTVLTAYCLAASIGRTDRLTVWTWNPSVAVSDYEFQTPALKGWRCNRKTGEPLDQVVEYINANIPREDSMLVFPDATLIYGLTGRDSYRKVPFMFHSEQIATGRWYVECREHLLANPPKWWVTRIQPPTTTHEMFSSVILKWLELKTFFETNYVLEWQHGQFQVYRFKPPVAVDAP